ncbi:MAG: hypothetical protein ACK5LZ_04645 [Anaerorhabdus sp.]
MSKKEIESGVQHQCPTCGSTDVSYNDDLHSLSCNYCRSNFQEKALQKLEDDGNAGDIYYDGARDISDERDAIITIKCTSCGAEVVVDMNAELNVQCHWCRNYLSPSEKISNGKIPDAVLPFAVSKKDAMDIMSEYFYSKGIFSQQRYVDDITDKTVRGVYFPYIVVDVKASAKFMGKAEHSNRKVAKQGRRKLRAVYCHEYVVESQFDIEMNGLTLDGSTERMDYSEFNSNNIINAILPFDVENGIKWNAQYLKNFTSEKRNINISTIEDIVKKQIDDVARFNARKTLQNEYSRGISWESEEIEIGHKSWRTMYLPVWIYSYEDDSGTQYIAVNGRTKEVAGKIPYSASLMVIIAIAVGVMLFWLGAALGSEKIMIYALFIAIACFTLWKSKFSTKSERHKHEKDTACKISNVSVSEQLYDQGLRLTDEATINNENGDDVNGVANPFWEEEK